MTKASKQKFKGFLYFFFQKANLYKQEVVSTWQEKESNLTLEALMRRSYKVESIKYCQVLIGHLDYCYCVTLRGISHTELNVVVFDGPDVGMKVPRGLKQNLMCCRIQFYSSKLNIQQ